MDKQSIDLNLTINETNLILAALGQQPFNNVFDLIGKIKVTADEQLKDKQEDNNDDNKNE